MKKKSDLDMSLTTITDMGSPEQWETNIGGAEMISEVVKYISECDAFTFIPIQFVDDSSESISIATKVKVFDRFDGNPDMMKGIYFSTLGALFASMCDYYPAEEIVKYIESVAQKYTQVSDVRH